MDHEVLKEGYGHTLLKGKKKVNGEFALIFSCYNFSRIVSILGVKGLISKAWGFGQVVLGGVAGWRWQVWVGICRFGVVIYSRTAVGSNQKKNQKNE
jgi:hypothetical protein